MPDLPFKISTTSFDAAQAEITVQYLSDELINEVSAAVTLQGKIVGPYCVDRTTVATSHALELVPDSVDTLRGRLPDPCFWSPETPFLYQIHVNVKKEQEQSFRFHWGIQSVQIKKNKFTIDGQPHLLRGVRLNQPLAHDLAQQLRQQHINCLVMPLEICLTHDDTPRLADSFGFHLLYEAGPDEETMLWQAESRLSMHISTLGYILPQASMQNPQLWHNAMLHLHRQRRDIFVGIQVDDVPLSMVQGHVEFLLVPQQHVEEVASVKVPKLVSVRRFDLLREQLPVNLAGRVSRVLPSD